MEFLFFLKGGLFVSFFDEGLGLFPMVTSEASEIMVLTLSQWSKRLWLPVIEAVAQVQCI